MNEDDATKRIEKWEERMWGCFGLLVILTTIALFIVLSLYWMNTGN